MFAMDDGVYGWLFKTASQNYWRVASMMEFEDLIQEGHFQWARVNERYGDQPDMNMPHMMALFKKVFMGHLITITEKQRRRPTLVYEHALVRDSASRGNIWEKLGGEDMCLPTFLDRLRTAPPEVQRVLEVLATDDGVAKLARPYRRRPDHRETFNDRLCRLIGVEPGAIDLAGMLHEFLDGGVRGGVR